MYQNHRILIIGLGLIGGSLAAALMRTGKYELWGYDTDTASLDKALTKGIIHHQSKDMLGAIKQVDVVVLAVPVKAIEKLTQLIIPHLPDTTVLTDVGSVKQTIVTAAQKVSGKLPVNVVPGHPIAGSELSGIDAIDVDLFTHHKVILTPAAITHPQALEQVAQIWRSLGCDIINMDYQSHDLVLAATSHLPHMLAFSLVDTLASDTDNTDIFRYAAGGFRDFTRVSGSDPIMWHDVFVANRDACLTRLDQFTEGLKHLRQAISTGDSQTMLGIMTRARAARHHFEKQITQSAYTEDTMDNQLHYGIAPGGKIQGQIRVPGDKSISHRAIILGSLAQGTTHVQGFLEGEDALATLQAFRDMGVVIEGPIDGQVTIHGVGLYGLKRPPGVIYVGNSGTSMRLFAGVLAGQEFATELKGDASLNQRPMQRVAQPLSQMGASITTTDAGMPPIHIKGNQPLSGIHYTLPMASAQVKSCLLLAGLYAQGETQVTEPAPTRDHTERMLQGFGYRVDRTGDTCRLTGGGSLQACDIDVPGDISSAAFFLVAAAITPGSDLLLEHVGINPTRIGILNILRLMGADIQVRNERHVSGEPVADLRIKHTLLHGIDVPEAQVHLGIDEMPALMIAAACAQGTTRISGAQELRVKESDRIQSMVDGLQILGVDIQDTADGAVIKGKGSDNQTPVFGGGEIVTHLDHRIAMAFSVAGLRASAPIKVLDCAHVATSFPNFVDLASQLGWPIHVHSA